MDFLTPEQEAASLSTTPERLQELASNSNDENVFRAITVNPNTPPEVLLIIGEHFPQEMLDNPVFELLLLGNPSNLVLEMPVKTIISLLNLEEIPTFLEQGITKHKERVQIASNTNTPEPILEILAQDAEMMSFFMVAENLNTSNSIY